MTENDTGPSPDTPPAGDSASLPHDRDEHPTAPTENGQHRHNRGVVEQGRRDVEAGIQDTERIGVPTTLPAEGGGKG